MKRRIGRTIRRFALLRTQTCLNTWLFLAGYILVSNLHLSYQLSVFTNHCRQLDCIRFRKTYL